MQKKNILIVGYPKSGTTWCTRLVAQLIDCPLGGEWGFKDVEPLYKEGEKRVSDYICYKSHHSSNELFTASTEDFFKLIYVIRDPRDIVISGMHYFGFSNKKRRVLKRMKLSKLIPLEANISEEVKKKRMIQAIIHGDKDISKWLSLPWNEHRQSYKDKDVLFVKYEDLIDTPEQECAKICQHLGISISAEQMKESIKKQSFEQQKKEIKTSKNPFLTRLLRQGSHGNWKGVLNESELKLFRLHFDTNEVPYEF